MVIRYSYVTRALLFMAVLSAATVACQKVPLLAPSGSVITLTAASTALPVNGTAQLVAQLLEPAGTPPHSGTQVIFTTTLGTIEPSTASTDINGRAVVLFKSGTANGTAIITASSGGASASGTNAVKIAVGTAAVGRVAVTASPTLIPAIGGSSTISASVFDINGNALSSAPVSFSTTAGSLDVLVGTTDQTGVATTTLRTSTTATVTANVGAQAPATTPPTASSGSSSGTVVVNVAGAPTLVITPPATPPSAGLPASYTFAVTAAATNGSVIRDLSVNWGDGRTQDLGAVTGTSVVSHVYTSPGAYTITGTLIDASGSVVVVSSVVTVNAKLQPNVSLSAPTTTPTAGTDTTFTASVTPAAGSGAVILDVTIDYGDGTKQDLGAASGTSISLHHVFTRSDTYTVTLVATDTNGGVGTAVTSVFVQPATPLGVSVSCTRTVIDTLNTLASCTATVTGLGNAVVLKYQWDFGDGTVQDTTTNQVTHNYSKPSVPATRVITVTVIASNGQSATGTTPFTP